ncbi:hypothetical protein RRF57_003776 [Xylaria bambusicola]|uniref:Uncharacterized protein n=1 Tax=Xylaria bambusicola TaxID=326684 RepID=A0AAN7UMB6_9PEZI
MLMCVSWTPFGKPVVPDEYTKNAGSFCGSTRIRPGLSVPRRPVCLISVKCCDFAHGVPPIAEEDDAVVRHTNDMCRLTHDG